MGFVCLFIVWSFVGNTNNNNVNSNGNCGLYWLAFLKTRLSLRERKVWSTPLGGNRFSPLLFSFQFVSTLFSFPLCLFFYRSFIFVRLTDLTRGWDGMGEEGEREGGRETSLWAACVPACVRG